MSSSLHISNADASLSAFRLVAAASGVPLSVVQDDTKVPYIEADGKKVEGHQGVLTHILGEDRKRLLGDNDAAKKEVTAWLSAHFTDTLPLLHANDKKLNVALHKINKALLGSVFVVGNSVSAADLVFYTAVHPLMTQWDEKERVIFMNITRWFDYIQHIPEVANLQSLPLINIKTDVPEQPKEKQAQNANAAKDKGNAAKDKGNAAKDKGNAAKDKGNAAKDKGKAAETSTSKEKEVLSDDKVPPKEGGEQKKGGEQQNKQEQPKGEQQQQLQQSKKEQQQTKKEQQPKKEQQQQQGGKGKGAAAPKEAPPKLSAVEDVSRFDIRVGRIVTCKKHEGADTLYVEQIECGEAEPRQVVSGLVKFIPLEEMQNRRVVILANLKASNMRGVRSQAMVLCASDDAHTRVELVEPPEGAKPGERVGFVGFEGDPEKVLAKETLEKVMPDLKSNGDLVATFRGVPFMTSAGVCKVLSIANGGIR